MKKILVSWYAYKNDFLVEKETNKLIGVDVDGPTIAFHKHFFADEPYERHIILTSRKSTDDPRMLFLQRELNQRFRDHIVEPRALNVPVVIDLNTILSKAGAFLESKSEYGIDLFISPGTPAMQTAWTLLHITKNLNTRLIQTWVDPATQEVKKAFVDVEKDMLASAVTIKQIDIEQPEQDQDYLYTESIKQLFDRASRVANTDKATVLILGPSGSGKENVAKHIHEQSARSKLPFEKVNCSAFTDDLLRSELFGHVKGAFTGATENKKGIIETADGGTVFLDEIGDISPFMQQSLLRVLQEGEIQRVGDAKSTLVDVRFIAATNADLLQKCESGAFRWDLFYRLAVVELEVPSLIERGPEDIKEYLEHFITSKARKFRRPPIQLEKALKTKLLSYTYPGNLREMENVVERLYVLAEDGKATIDHLPPRILHPPPSQSLLWQDVEKQHIEKVLIKNNYIQKRTQEDIGYGSINTLRNKIKEYRIEMRG